MPPATTFWLSASTIATRFGSQVEERFALDFGRAAPGWTVVR